MAEIDFYYPFDSISGDRKTVAATERRFFGALFTDGVVGADAFSITTPDAGSWTIGEGVAIIGGAIGGIVTAKTVTAAPAAGAKVYIVLRLDTTSAVRKITLEVVSSLATATDAQLYAGGQLDLPLYSVEGQIGGGYGLLDQRTYCTSFDNEQYTELFKKLETEIESDAERTLGALAQQFTAAISAANTENAGLYGAAGRQGFVNPTFAVNQRGQASYSLASGSAYTYDRWKVAVNGRALASAMTVAAEQDGARLALKMATQPFVSGTTTSRVRLIQNIEGGVRTFCTGGRQFTVSFDAKASEACSLGVEALQYAVTGGSFTRAGAQTVSVTTEWKRFSLTFTGSASLTAEQVQDVLQMAFYVAWYGYGDKFTVAEQAGGHTVWLANMQLNEGTSILPCYVRDYGDELERCQRYYVALGITTLSVGSLLLTGKQAITCPLPLTRRLYRTPDVAVTDRANVAGVASAEVAAGGWRNGLAFTVSNQSEDAPVFVVTNTDSAEITRVVFNSVALDAEITD